MFNRKFTYMYIFDITPNFDLFKRYISVWNHNDYSKCYRRGTNMISVDGLFMFTDMTLGVHNHQEEIHGLKPVQTHCSPQSPFHGLLGFYTGLGLAMYALLLGVVLCRARSWTQWSLWVTYNKSYSVILWLSHANSRRHFQPLG